MNRAKLREKVRAEFGPNLERVTPAGAREFLERLYRELHLEALKGGIMELDDTAGSYEQIMAEFFSRTLDMPPEDAAVALWLWAFENYFASIGEEYNERFLSIFGRMDLSSDNDNT
jgi:hypothetical protein